MIFVGPPTRHAMHDAALGMLVFFQIIHKSGIWLSRESAKKAMDAVNLFCTSYSFCASEFHRLSIPRYHVQPSLHLFKHAAVRLQQQLNSGAARVLSPTVHLCENSEDFVGQVARISRRVAARTCGLQTLQRYLIKAHLLWSN